jgi:hypothetical protein
MGFHVIVYGVVHVVVVCVYTCITWNEQHLGNICVWVKCSITCTYVVSIDLFQLVGVDLGMLLSCNSFEPTHNQTLRTTRDDAGLYDGGPYIASHTLGEIEYNKCDISFEPGLHFHDVSQHVLPRVLTCVS